MSSDGEFEQFVRSADALGTPTADDVQRVKASLSSHVSWKRGLPTAMTDALRTSSAAASISSRFRGRSLKLAAVAISTFGLSATIYVTSTAPVRGGGPSEIALRDVVVPTTAPSGLPSPAPANDERREPANDEIPVPTIDDPAKLPTALPAPPPAKDARRAGTLDAEVALLTETNAALHANNPARSLALVDRHAREFPRGVLGPEFEAQRILSLSALGRHDEACALASRFLSAHPNSPLAPQVHSSCEDSNR